MNKSQVSLVPVPGDAGALYAIPAESWEAISARVSTVIQLVNDDDLWPDFAALGASCKLWQSTTFPNIIAQSVLVSTFATKAVQALQELANGLEGLQPDDELPPTVRFHYLTRINSLATSATTYRDAMDAQTPDIFAFVALNILADLTGGPVLGSLTECCAPLDNAVRLLLGSWVGLSDQLVALSSGRVEITTAGLLAEDIQAIITDWNRLNQAAADFDGMASNLT